MKSGNKVKLAVISLGAALPVAAALSFEGMIEFVNSADQSYFIVKKGQNHVGVDPRGVVSVFNADDGYSFLVSGNKVRHHRSFDDPLSPRFFIDDGHSLLEIGEEKIGEFNCEVFSFRTSEGVEIRRFYVSSELGDFPIDWGFERGVTHSDFLENLKGKFPVKVVFVSEFLPSLTYEVRRIEKMEIPLRAFDVGFYKQTLSEGGQVDLSTLMLLLDAAEK